MLLLGHSHHQYHYHHHAFSQYHAGPPPPSSVVPPHVVWYAVGPTPGAPANFYPHQHPLDPSGAPAQAPPLAPSPAPALYFPPPFAPQPGHQHHQHYYYPQPHAVAVQVPRAGDSSTPAPPRQAWPPPGAAPAVARPAGSATAKRSDHGVSASNTPHRGQRKEFATPEDRAEYLARLAAMPCPHFAAGRCNHRHCRFAHDAAQPAAAGEKMPSDAAAALAKETHAKSPAPDPVAPRSS